MPFHGPFRNFLQSFHRTQHFATFSSSQLKQTEEYPIDKDYEFFVSPYDDGDGYEMKAVAIDKCRYISFFLARGGHIVVQIDKTVRVKVIYEDRENIKIAQEELNDIVGADKSLNN